MKFLGKSALNQQELGVRVAMRFSSFRLAFSMHGEKSGPPRISAGPQAYLFFFF